MDPKTLAKYPFLEEAKGYIASLNISMEEMRNHPIYGSSINLGKQRVLDAINGKTSEEIDLTYPELNIMSYAFARLLVNINKSSFLKSIYATAEAERAYYFMRDDQGDIVKKISEDVGFKTNDGTVPLIEYLKLVSRISSRDPRWKPINRKIDAGLVSVSEPEALMLLREAIRLKILQPVATRGVPREFVDMANNIRIDRGGATPLMKLDQVDEGALPRCISNMLAMLERGESSHNVMFILGTFFINLGLNEDDVVEIFSRSPKFDEKTTRYQLKFLTGERGGTRYSAPSCEKIRSYGMCDTDCKVKHPVSYYRRRMRRNRYGAKPKETEKKKNVGNEEKA